MSENRIKEYRTNKGITMNELSKKTGISIRIYMSFRKRYKKQSISRGDEEYSKSIRCKSFRSVFLGVKIKSRKICDLSLQDEKRCAIINKLNN